MGGGGRAGGGSQWTLQWMCVCVCTHIRCQAVCVCVCAMFVHVCCQSVVCSCEKDLLSDL